MDSYGLRVVQAAMLCAPRPAASSSTRLRLGTTALRCIGTQAVDMDGWQQ